MSEAVNQIKIGAALDGTFDTTIQSGKRKMGELGAAAREAGKGTGAIGDGMAGSAQKVEAATKNMVGSIQRQIAALEAGDKSSRQYQESLARMRGIDTAALKPYLDQLDAAKLKQSEAAKSAESLAGSMGSIKIAAVAIGASLGALAMFSKNIIDAADGLNDLSQRVGISVRELGKYQLAAEQSGTSLESISKGVKGLAKSMVENGDALRKAGVDATSADGAMQQLADVFSEMPDGIEKTTLATKLFGKAGMDLIPMLNLGSEGLRDAALASAEYAEQMAIMAPLADSLNDKMAVVALSSKTAGAIMVNEFLPSLDKIAQAFVDSKDGANSFAGVLGSVVNSTAQVAALLISDVVFVLKATGREIGAIAAQAVALASLDFKGFSAISDAVKDDAARARVELDKFQDNLVNGTVNIQAAYNKRQGIGEVLKDGARGSNLLRSLGVDGEAKKALAEANRELEEQNRLIAENAGLTASFAKDWGMLSKMFLLGKLSLDQLTEAQAKLLAKQPFAIAEAKASADLIKAQSKAASDGIKFMQAENKAYEDHAKVLRASEKAIEDYADSAKLMADDLVFETQLIGLNTAERERAIEQRKIQLELDKEIRRINDTAGLTFEEKESQKAIAMQAAVSKASTAAARSSLNEWAKTADSIRDSLVDAFDSAILTGKDLFTSLRDAAVKLFDGLVLRPILQGVLQPVATALTGSLIGTAANAATGASAASGLLSSVTGIGASAGAGSISSLLGSSGMGALDVGGLSMAGIEGALAAIPVGGWALMATAAVAAIASGRGETRMGASYVTGADGKASLQMGPSGGEIAGDTAKSLFNATKTSIQDTLKLVGSSATVSGFVAGLESSKDGKGFAYAGGLINGKGFGDYKGRDGGQFGFQTMNAEQAMSAYVNELKKSTLEALQAATDIPKLLSDQLAGIDINALDQVGLDKLVGDISSTVNAVNGFVTQINTSGIKELHDLGFAAAAGLIAASGGLDQLNTNLNTYYSNFYTAEEQRAQTIANINKATAGSGLDAATATRAQFRALVEAQDLTTESGRKTYAALIGVSGAFATLTPSTEDAAKAVNALNKSLEDAAKAFEDAAKANVNNTLAALKKSVDLEKNRVTIARDAAKELASSTKGVFDLIKAQIDDLYGTVSSTQAMQGVAGQAFIDQALATAKATGYLPDQADLANAIKGARTGLSPDNFASKFESDRATLLFVSKLSQLQDLSGTQLTAAERAAKAAEDQLTTLDKILATAQDQADAYNGLDTSVKSVADAVAMLQDALGIKLDDVIKNTYGLDALGRINKFIADQNAATGGLAYDSVHAQASVMALAAEALKNGWTTAMIAQATGYSLKSVQELFAGKGVAGMAASGAKAPVTTIGGATPGQAAQTSSKYTDKINLGGISYDILDPERISRLDSVNAYVNTLDFGEANKANSVATLYATAMQYGVSQKDIAAASGYSIDDIQKLFAAQGIPAFAVGTNYVPSDMIAKVHEGEAIVPKAYNPAAGGQDSATLVAEIRSLREENRDQASAMVQMQQRLTKLMERWDGNGMPETRVTA